MNSERLSGMVRDLVVLAKHVWHSDLYSTAELEETERDLLYMIERTTPKKVTVRVDHDGQCPSCEYFITECDRFCSDCGQALDWDDSNE